ncbi:MAG: HupE/UreJ family protein [Casimicrobiaceae bacterium]
MPMLVWAVPSSALAHESRPAYLELKEVAPGRFNVLWRTPVLSGMRLPVALKLPEAFVSKGEPVVQQLNDSLIERRVVESAASEVEGQRIEFIGLQGTITDVLVRMQLLDGSQQTSIVRPSQPWFEFVARQSAWAVAGAYSLLGIEHILLGVDHLLFVLALLIICRSTRQLIQTVTAFTVAHSITLALATLGFVHVPQSPVEAMIALSIVFVAAEIVHARRGIKGITARAPWVVAFVFGLLHGFGFAGALSEVGLPQGQIPVALLFFNLGVEAGQLMFIVSVLAAIALVRRSRIAVSSSAALVAPYAIGCIAMFWVFQRLANF